MNPQPAKTPRASAVSAKRPFKVGDRVRDMDGDVGTVFRAEDQHNVMVEYDKGGRSTCCQFKWCKKWYFPLTHIRRQPRPARSRK